jgi:protein adenylyltransferase
MSILGLTIDYGPYGFLDAFDPMFICNHSDSQGRYAFVRQPNVAFWNLHALGQALLPLIEDSDAALAAIGVYKEAFAQALEKRLRAKIGLIDVRDDDRPMIDGLRTLMADDKADHTLTWRRLAGFDSREGATNDSVRDMFLQRDKFDAWAAAYAARLRSEHSVDAERAERMNRVNPKFILRNHLAELAIRAAQGGDFSEIDRLLKVLGRPFDEQPDNAAYADFPPDWAQSIEVSCSS